MIEENKKVTNYLRKAVLAQVDKGIDFKNEEFYRISKQCFISGNIDPNITLKLFENNKKENQKNHEKENVNESLYVIVAAKVIKTEVEGSQKKEELEDLTGIFFIPAMIDLKSSSLHPAIEDNKLPWFPREILKPMIEPELAIGDSRVYDEVVSDGIYNLYKIVSWEDYISYCKNIYEKTTTCDFFENEVYNMNGKREKILLEDNVYIFLDKTINPSYHIRKLYNNIMKQDDPMPLYENFISLHRKEDRQLLENSMQNRKIHYGQMGGKYGLSPSQRESLNHFNNMKNAEILAVKGPPGTGKTTLLQSVVASKYVANALGELLPPLTVASSTNNQAVTNIIESFGRIVPKFNNNLETRWIENVNSFAIYFPSSQKVKSALKRGFQCTNSKGEYSLLEIENEENIKKSKEKFLKEAEKIFTKIGENETKSISTYKKKIHNRLVYINKIQNNLIDIVKQLQELIQHIDTDKEINNEQESTTIQTINNQQKRIKKQEIIGESIEDINQVKNKLEEYIQSLKNEQKEKVNRVLFWENKYKQIPKFWKILSWMQKYKMRISSNLKIYLNEDEKIEGNIINIDLIKEYYASRIEENNLLIRKAKEILDNIKNCVEKYESELEKLQKCGIDTTNIKRKLIINNSELDSWLDTNTRYVSFWLAVHYYEARWLEGECALTPKQKGTTFSNVLINFYKRLSMITPCMVMTFYMLPKYFATFDIGSKEFLYNLIDTLIVDEAGQASTEIAACSFALAKKAIVVGDEKQIQPVWGVEKTLDKSLAIQEKIIENEKQFIRLEEHGITASSSSVMRVACKSSNYSKYGEKGLFLSEHRRCCDDIIQYCNELVYKGKLKPLRGNKTSEILPKMGYYLIQSQYSKKVGTSRCNTYEAVGIARWILENEKKIFHMYTDIEQDKILGIITPFKEQASELKRVFKQIMPEYLRNKITIGTVHVFQGGERKIIIMSTTYGSSEGCFFIDNNKNLMNVAVSRAEDSFLVFGDINCLKDEDKSPSGLLKKYVKSNKIKEEV